MAVQAGVNGIPGYDGVIENAAVFAEDDKIAQVETQHEQEQDQSDRVARRRSGACHTVRSKVEKF